VPLSYAFRPQSVAIAEARAERVCYNFAIHRARRE
jgi:hypothetical protein